MNIDPITREDLAALVKEAVAASVAAQPLSPDEIQWVRLAIQAEVQRAEFRKAVIEKTLVALIISFVAWLGVWLVDVFQTYLQHKNVS